jgi:hypothetical protein
VSIRNAILAIVEMRKQLQVADEHFRIVQEQSQWLTQQIDSQSAEVAKVIEDIRSNASRYQMALSAAHQAADQFFAALGTDIQLKLKGDVFLTADGFFTVTGNGSDSKLPWSALTDLPAREDEIIAALAEQLPA